MLCMIMLEFHCHRSNCIYDNDDDAQPKFQNVQIFIETLHLSKPFWGRGGHCVIYFSLNHKNINSLLFNGACLNENVLPNYSNSH